MRSKKQESFQPRPELEEVSHALVQRARAEGKKSDWRHRNMRPPISDRSPQAFIFPIISGETIIRSTRDPAYTFIGQNYRDARAVESGAYGVLKMAQAIQVSALIVNTITDRAGDLSKYIDGTLETAAQNASAFAFEILAKVNPDEFRQIKQPLQHNDSLLSSQSPDKQADKGMTEKTPQFDICIVCALWEEAEAVIKEFSARCKVKFKSAYSKSDGYQYRYTTIQNNQHELLTVLVTWPEGNGLMRTGPHLKAFLQEFHPRFAAMTGICAGYKEKVKLGDLIVAEYTYFYEEGKDTISKDGQKKHELQTRTYGATPQVTQYARGFEDWREPVVRLKRPKMKLEELKGSEAPKEKPPECYIAPMASGMAVKEDEPFPWLREYINRNTLALEMEAGAFYFALREFPGIHSLVVKGVCDYADGSKNDEYHKYAARASAIYLLYFIREHVSGTTMPE